MKTGTNGQSRLTRGQADVQGVDNRDRVEFAKQSIEKLAMEAIRGARTGTIGIEIPVKDGRLGKVKRLLIDFQSD